jgi:hypothetical protein
MNTPGAEFLPGLHTDRFGAIWRKGYDANFEAYAVTAGTMAAPPGTGSSAGHSSVNPRWASTTSSDVEAKSSMVQEVYAPAPGADSREREPFPACSASARRVPRLQSARMAPAEPCH